jgi:large subunit ribosomal protein L4
VKATVLNIKKEQVGEVELSDDVFAVTGGSGKIYETVKMQQANRRKGSAATRNRALVSGTTAKMYRQKGTGRARHGDYRTNVFVGGGKSFGPHPRDYSYGIPKKVRKGALRTALSEKARDGKLHVVDSFELPQIKTKLFVEAMKALGVDSALVVLDESDSKAMKSSRNLPQAKALRWDGLNVIDVLRFDHVVFTKSALDKVQEVLKS